MILLILIMCIFINSYSVSAFRSYLIHKNSLYIRNFNKNINRVFSTSLSGFRLLLSSYNNNEPINIEDDKGILDLADFGLDFPEISSTKTEPELDVVDSTTLSMQETLWNELRGDNEYVTKDTLKYWDEIQDFKDRGLMDDYILDVIFKEVGLQLNENELSFAQCIEAIDLINSVALALDQANFNNKEDDYIETEETEYGALGSTEWMLNAMNMNYNMESLTKKE